METETKCDSTQGQDHADPWPALPIPLDKEPIEIFEANEIDVGDSEREQRVTRMCLKYSMQQVVYEFG